MVWLECSGPGHIWHTVSAWEEIGQKVGDVLEGLKLEISRWWCGRPNLTAILTTCLSTCPGRNPATSQNSPWTFFLVRSQRKRWLLVRVWLGQCSIYGYTWNNFGDNRTQLNCFSGIFLWMIICLGIICLLSSFCQLVLLKGQAPHQKCLHVSSTWGDFNSST